MARRRVFWLVAGTSSALGALVFLWWAIQTVWLGSFPGRDIDPYSRWALAQLCICIVCLGFAIVAFVKLARTR